MTEAVGILGAVLLALCGVPEVLRSWRRGYSDIGLGFLGMWLAGEVLLMWYVLATTADPILLVNYGFNVVLTLELLRLRRKR